MMTREPVWRRYARLFGMDPKRDTEEELSFHYEMRVRDYRKQGLDEAAARAAASERLGDLEAVRRACDDLGERTVREVRRREWLGELRQDVTFGLRVLARSPGFTTVAVLTLALGIGATTAIFSVVNRVLLLPLPFPESERLVNVWEASPQGDDHNVVSPGNYLDWVKRSRSFDAIGGYNNFAAGVALTGDGEPVQVMASDLTPSAMQTLRASPLLGRVFGEEDWTQHTNVALLSEGLWQQRFGSDRNVLGRTIMLNDVSYTVVGVMPASFEFPSDQTQIWRPISADELDPTERRTHYLSVIGRLKPGVSVTSASAEMKTIARSLATEYPQYMSGWSATVIPLHEDLTTDAKPLLVLLFATVGIVLLIACGNLANLLLARAIGREGEMSVRGALGAGRGRLARQLLTESLLIAGLGGAVGVLISALALRVLIATAPDNIPLLNQVRIDLDVFGFAAGVTVLSTLLFGLVPALRLSRADLHSAIRTRGGSSAAGHTRLRGALLVLEVALSVVLLVGAGLLVRSFRELQRTELGYRADGLVSMDVNLPRARYAGTPQHLAFYERLRERLRAVPGVVAVASTSAPPVDGTGMTFSFGIEGRQASNPSGREDPEVLHAVSPEYFRTLGIPLTTGREFEARDRAGAARVVIINELLARKHWPNENPVGKRISFRPGEEPWLEIVAIAGDTRMQSPDQAPVPALYIPFAQKTWDWLSWQTMIARVGNDTDPEALRGQFRAALWELDDQLPLQSFDSVRDLYGHSLARRSFALALVLTFALLALTLSIVGLYGLMAFTVAQQKREIGVRMALGATRGDVIRTVLGKSMTLTTIGLAIGVIAALAATRLLDTLLYGVKSNDPVTLVAISFVVTATALLASWLPAHRAVRTNPSVALRGA